MPPGLVEKYRPRVADLGDDGAVAACFQEFCSGVIDAVAESAACVKPQAAFFEQYGAPGWSALRAVVRCAHQYELPVILDAKRGDIASTGAAYGRAAFGGAPGLDAPVARPRRRRHDRQPLPGRRLAGAPRRALRRRQGRVRPHAHQQPRRRPSAGARSGRPPAVPACRRSRGAPRRGTHGRTPATATSARSPARPIRRRCVWCARRCRTPSCWCPGSAPRAPAPTPSRASPPATRPASSSTLRARSSSRGSTTAATFAGLPPPPPNLCAAELLPAR